MTAAVSCALACFCLCCGYALLRGKAARRTLDDKAIVRPATVSESGLHVKLSWHGHDDGAWRGLAAGSASCFACLLACMHG